jgi:hypothetical protein
MLSIFGDENVDFLLDHCYKNQKNYKERLIGSNVVVVFFTSNALWQEPNSDSFNDRVIKNDYYDYWNVTKSKYFVKYKYDLIFIRDIYLSWYAYGINKNVHSQIDLKNFLIEKTKPYDKVIMVGSSAGGYAALLFGTQINASKIIVFSSQANLNVYLSFYKNNDTYNYFDINDGRIVTDLSHLIKDYNGYVYYFYAKGAEVDISQYRCLSELFNVVAFPIKSNDHARTLFAENMLDVICCPENKLKRLSKISKVKGIGSIAFCFLSTGIFRFFNIIIKKLIRTVFKKNTHVL